MTNSDEPVQNAGRVELSAISPKDKPWDRHRSEADQVQLLYEQTLFDSYAERMKSCSGFLEFGVVNENDELNLKLKTARFCKVRHCPVCSWRKSLMWTARFCKALPQLIEDHPHHRYIFLTLTVKNCHVTDLRETLKLMNKAWDRMSKRKVFPAIGVVRKMEVTRNHDDNTAHPHFHCLLMVDKDYFRGSKYLSQAKWTDLWRKALKVSYDPVVHVKTIKCKKEKDLDQYLDNKELNALCSAVIETTKYSIKPEDLIGKDTIKDAEWLQELTSQVAYQRMISLSGLFKQYLSESEPEDLISEDDDQTDALEEYSLFFNWHKSISKYLQVRN